MAKFEDYANRYESIKMERRNGVIQLTFHTEGGPLYWGEVPHREFPDAFRALASDPENKVVILTGTGEHFSGRRGPRWFDRVPREWDKLYWEGKQLLMGLLDIEVPVIAAVNGPTDVHSEIPLLSDIVLAADHATFQDAAHFPAAVVPGDGVNITYLLLLGPNRGRYFLLTGETLTAHQAKDLGLVGEVLPQADLLPRAWELAEKLAQQNPLLLRYTRVLLTQKLKREFLDMLGYGLTLEALSSIEDGIQAQKPS